MEKNVIRVRKRDGFEESFDAIRLSESLQAAADNWIPEGGWLGQLVRQIRTQLGQRGEAVETEKMASMCEALLRSSGLAEAADSYTEYRCASEQAVAKMRVHTGQGRQTRSAIWNRSLLARQLVQDRYLEYATARLVARSVERRFALSGQVHLTGKFVAAAADNECRTLGLSSQGMNQDYVGVERNQLRAWLGGDGLPITGAGGGGVSLTLSSPGSDSRVLLGEEVLARFALEEVLGTEESEALARGDFFLPQLGDWLRPARIRLRPSPQEGENDFWARVRVAKGNCRELQIFLPGSWDWSSQSELAPEWLQGFGRLRLGTSSAALAYEWAMKDQWVRMPLNAFLQAAMDLRHALAATDRCVLIWQPPKRLPPLADQTHQILDGAAVINLGGPARLAGPGKADQFLKGVRNQANLASQALAALASRGLGRDYPRATLLPAGLVPALENLFPGDSYSSDRVRRLLLSLRQAMESGLRGAGLRPTDLAPPHSGTAGIRLSELEGIPPHESYSCGWGLPMANGLPAASSFDTAPWLEFPASGVQNNPVWAAKHTTSCT